MECWINGVVEYWRNGLLRFACGGCEDEHTRSRRCQKSAFAASILRRVSNAPVLQHSSTPTLHYSNTPVLQHSITPSLHHSITPTLHYSTTPLLHHSTTPSFHHSAFHFWGDGALRVPLPGSRLKNQVRPQITSNPKFAIRNPQLLIMSIQ
jgi:hypothetical protein